MNPRIFRVAVRTLVLLVALTAVAGWAVGGLQDTAKPPETKEPERRAVPRPSGEPQRQPETRSGDERRAEPRGAQRNPETRSGDEHRAEPREAQRRPPRPAPPPPPRPRVPGRHFVFIGGYYYDPFFGPYPWWPRTAYHGWYFPIYDQPSEVRVIALPRETAVYVDGFYAGIVDDFDGIFQELPLPPGGHQITLYLEGYRTAHHSIYLHAGSTFRLHHTMEPLPPGVVSEPPASVAPVPPPPPGTYTSPRTPPPVSTSRSAPAPASADDDANHGTLELRVQPAGAVVMIDGQRWLSSDEGSYVIDVPVGRRRVEISLQGYRAFTGEVDIRSDDTTPLNVSLMPDRPL